MNRMMFTAAETGDTGDNMQIVTGKDRLQITIEEPWAGSTETGFGYTRPIHHTPPRIVNHYHLPLIR